MIIKKHKIENACVQRKHLEADLFFLNNHYITVSLIYIFSALTHQNKTCYVGKLDGDCKFFVNF